jgi:hypothetical protein
MMMKSVARSVAVNTVSILRVSLHCVKKKKIGAQFHDQCVPHWNTVAKVNATVQAMIMTIMILPNFRNLRLEPNIRSQRNNIDTLINPKVTFSVIWKAYLYIWTSSSSLVGVGRLLTKMEWPVMVPCTVAAIKMPLHAKTKNFIEFQRAISIRYVLVFLPLILLPTNRLL